MSIRDIEDLRLQRRQIQEALQETESKFSRLSEIALKKTISKSKLGLTAANNTLTSSGLPISEFRLPIRTVKSLPLLPKLKNDEPTPVTNPNILKIRHEHLQKTLGKAIIKEISKQQEVVEAKRLQKIAVKKRVPTHVTVPPSLLAMRYTRGELPCTIEHGTTGQYLSWACPLENLDYDFYLPIFFDGLQCADNPACFVARQGIEDLLLAAKGSPDRIRPIIKTLISPLKNAMYKFDDFILLGVIKVLQQLVRFDNSIAQELIRYGKSYLSFLSPHLEKNKNTGDAVDFGQRKGDDLGEEVRIFLELLEERGGPRALATIKFSIPVYQAMFRTPPPGTRTPSSGPPRSAPSPSFP